MSISLETIKVIMKSPTYLSRLTEEQRQFYKDHSGCGCNVGKLINYTIMNCRESLDEYCKEFEISLE